MLTVQRDWPVSLTCNMHWELPARKPDCSLCHTGLTTPAFVTESLGCDSGLCHWPVSMACVPGLCRWPVSLVRAGEPVSPGPVSLGAGVQELLPHNENRLPRGAGETLHSRYGQTSIRVVDKSGLGNPGAAPALGRDRVAGKQRTRPPVGPFSARIQRTVFTELAWFTAL